MTLAQPLIKELQVEARTTRRVLERVPEASFTWRPHEKSMTLLRLASHLAEAPGWIVPTLTLPEMDFAKSGFKPEAPNDLPGILKMFDDNIRKGVDLLSGQSDEELQKTWRLTNAGNLILEMAREQVIRYMVLNHSVHHRGQLSVYLRMLNVAVPSIYGPSADEQRA
jgi:uncharacterized damage-inducible protein DinB